MDIRHKSFAWKAVLCGTAAVIMTISAGIAVLRQASANYKDRPTFYDVHIGTLTVPVEIADTPETLEKGLSGRLHLPKKHGMLFIFPVADTYSFWMPDMHFPIDLLWIDETGTIIGLEEAMQPEKDLKNPQYYTPPGPVRYVLELNAGFVKKHGVSIGQVVEIPDTSTGRRAFF